MFMKTVFTTAVVSVLGALLLPPAAIGAEPESCSMVRMSDPGWTDITATNAVAGVLLEALGYQQRVDQVGVPIAYEGLKKGQIDVFLGNWMPAQRGLIEPKIKEGAIEVLRPNLENVRFTLAVPSYVAEAGVKSFADLARFSDRFERKIYGIESGAAANQNIARMLKAKDFGLDGWMLVESSEQGMLTQVARQVHSKKWIVFLAWEPHLMNVRYDLTYLSGGDNYFGPNYGSATVNTVARRGYATQCANVGRLFSQIKFSVDLENQIITDVLEKKTDAKQAAARHLKNHSALLESWLAGVQTRDGGDGLAAVRKTLASAD